MSMHGPQGTERKRALCPVCGYWVEVLRSHRRGVVVRSQIRRHWRHMQGHVEYRLEECPGSNLDAW